MPGVDAAAAGVDPPGTGVNGVAPNKFVLVEVAGVPKALGTPVPNALPVKAVAPNIPGVVCWTAPNVLEGVEEAPNVPKEPPVVGACATPKLEGVCGAPNVLPGAGDGALVELGENAREDPVIVPP